MKITNPSIALIALSAIGGAHAQDTLNAPVLESPTVYTELRNPEFRWQSQIGAEYYYLWIDDGSGRDPIKQWLSSTEANCATGGVCYCTLSEWIAGETKWWVTAWMEPAVYSDWSDVGIFTSAITGTYPPLEAALPEPPAPPPGQ